MAKFVNGILGPIRGKVGTVVGSSWKGRSYVRSIGKTPSKSATPAQAQARERFKVASRFTSAVYSFLEVGYYAESSHITQRNLFMKHLLLECIEEDSSDIRLAYSNIRLSSGKLPPMLNGVISATDPQVIDFRWICDQMLNPANQSDGLSVCVYSPELNQAWIQHGIASRSEERTSVRLPMNFSGKEVHVYASFIQSEAMLKKGRPFISDSLYLGSLVVL